MEMCYDGALVMPSSYAVMSEDEMTYVDGGGINLSWDKVKTVGIAFLAVVGAINTIVDGFSNAIKFGKFIKGISQSAFVSGIATKFSAAIGRIATWISAHAGAIAAVIGGIIGLAGGFALGKYIAGRTYDRYHK